MPEQSAEQRNEEIVAYVYGFSREAFEVARAFVQGDDPEARQREAEDLKARLPAAAGRAREASDAYRPDLNRTLSEANLDIEYVLAGGGRPSSIRLAGLIEEQEAR
jgi:hypothetical protein